MRKIFEFFIHKPLLVNLSTLIIVIVGLIAFFSIQRETFPKVEFDIITIRTNYIGSSPEDVEKLITIPIERELKGIDGIKKINAISGEGFSVFTIQVEPDYDLNEVYMEVKDTVETIDDLPDDSDPPVFKKIDNKTQSTLKVALYGGDYGDLKVIAKRLRDKLEILKPVSKITLEGYNIDEIRVEIDLAALSKYELTVRDIARILDERNINLSAGPIETPDGDIIVRTVAEFVSTEEIKNLVVRSNPTGQKIRISDLAHVERRPEKGEIFERSQAERAIFLDVFLKNKEDVISSTEVVKTVVADFYNDQVKGKYPKISYRFSDDFSYYVKRRLNILTGNGLQGVVLVVICLLFFLNKSTSVVTTLGIPIALCITFMLMDLSDMSINLISMFGLILVLGMLVDDSIIVAEHFYQKLEEGNDRYEAAKLAAVETFKPVLGTVATTMVAFGSLYFMGGIMGKFLAEIPTVVIICLSASLIECFIFLPSHLAEFTRPPKNSNETTRWYNPLIAKYKKLLRSALRFPFILSGGFIALFFLSLFILKTMSFELFPGDDVRIVFLNIKGEVGVPIEKTDAEMLKLEKMVLEEVKPQELDQIRTRVGAMMEEQNLKIGSQYGTVIIYLTPPDERERSTDDLVDIIVRKAKSLVPNYNISVFKMQGGPPKGKPVEVELLSANLEEIKAISKEVKVLLENTPGVLSSEIDFEEGKKQIIAYADDQEARRLGVSTISVAMELRRIYSQDSVTEILEDDEDIPIRIYLNKEFIQSVEALKKIHVLNEQGSKIPLSHFVKFKMEPGSFVIRRKDRKRIISVSATLNKEITTPMEITKTITPALERIFKNHPDASFNFGGENEDTKESMDGLKKSIIIAFFCIFLILVLIFNSIGESIVIMSVLPMAIIGVILAFLVKGIPISFMALLGVVGLAGVVVNDSIVMVEFINVKRQTISDDIAAIVEASGSRIRQVFLTTVTTVSGLLPVAHAGLFGGSSGDPFLKPMAFSFAYGLIFASSVTLFFVPSNYLIYLKIKNRFRDIFSSLKNRVADFKGGRV